MFNCETYFYNQRKTKRFEYRRLRIIDDSYSCYGGGDRATVTFRGAADTESRPNYLRRPSTAGILRPASSRSRQVDPTAGILPPVDPLGPKLVTAAAESVASEAQRSSLKAEKPRQTPSQGRKSDWNINEAKFASSSILSRLSKSLYLVSQDFEVNLSLDLVDELNRGYKQLIENTVTARRKWQTDSYNDFQTNNKQPFLTASPDNQRIRYSANVVVSNIVRKQLKNQEKRVQLKKKPIVTKMCSPERPMTARSVMSNFSVKSDASHPSEDGRESRNDYDLLPAELRPTILHYRRESSVPKLKTVRTSTATRLEKVKKLTLLATSTFSSRHKKKKAKFQEVEVSEKGVEDDNTEAESPTKASKPLEFRLSVPQEEDWIVVPGDSEDPEANTLRLWEKQLKELMRSRQEEKILAKQKGEDGPLFVKFYNDPRMRSLRTKGHQRAATFPMPSVFSKLPPSVASFSTPVPNDALLIGEGLTVFVLTLPDSSGCCNYHSGRTAISMSRHSVEARGLYTLLYEDREGSPLIGYFTPAGGGGCYHLNGGLRMIYDKEGGSLFDEDGVTARKWSWPTDGLNMSVAVNIQVNANMSLRCTSLTSITLRFSCRGQSHKFALSSADTLEESAVNPDQGRMQSDVFFYSKFAMSHSDQQLANVDVKKEPLKKRSALKSTGSPPPELEDGMDRPARELADYRGRIRSVVDDWMEHYRESIGIALPKRLLSSSKRHADHLSSASLKDLGSFLSFGGDRQANTSMGFYPRESSSRHGKHARSHTHPFPSPNNSRSPSPLLQFGLPALRTKTSSTLPATPLIGRHSTSPPHAPLTPRESPHSRLQSPEPLKPFKTGTSKPKPAVLRNYTGCPVSLHEQLLRNLKSTPRCKCDKRHIPFISDVEFTAFLSSQVPKTQLIIVCVVSSVVENSCACEPMLSAIYCTLNRNRFSPCNQSAMDEYRVLRYDVCQSTRGEGSSSEPMLVERHNATPGTFLMYRGRKLVYADCIFNGYGTARKDFAKQVQKSVLDSKMGKCLPNDFKLSQRNGGKIQNRSAWAYPVSGVMQDLIPFTPESGSGCTSRHSVTDVTDLKLEDTFTETSFADMSYTEEVATRSSPQLTLSSTLGPSPEPVWLAQ